jgi:Protein of unknown function (DUF3551)
MLRIEYPNQWRSNMKTISMTAIALVFALSAIAFDAGAAKAGPIVPRGHACLEYPKDGTTDCSFTSYAQCEATASGLAAECYGSATTDDEHSRRQFPRVGLQQQLHTRF